MDSYFINPNGPEAKGLYKTPSGINSNETRPLQMVHNFLVFFGYFLLPNSEA